MIIKYNNTQYIDYIILNQTYNNTQYIDNIILNQTYNNTNYNNFNHYYNIYYGILYIFCIIFIIRLCKFICNKLYIYKNKIIKYSPRFNYIKINNVVDDNCSICLEKIDNKCITLECNHSYHKKCIKLWIKEIINNPNINVNCPICKNDIVIL